MESKSEIVPGSNVEINVNLSRVSMYGKFPSQRYGFHDWGYAIDSGTGVSKLMELGQTQRAEQYRDSYMHEVPIASIVTDVNPPKSALVFHTQETKTAVVTYWGFLEDPFAKKGRKACQVFYRELDPDIIGSSIDNGYNPVGSFYRPQFAEDNASDFLAQSSVQMEKLIQTPTIFKEEKCRQLIVEIFLRLMRGQRIVVENVNPATKRPFNTEEKILIGQSLMLMCRAAGESEAIEVWATDPILKVPANLIFRESKDRPWHIPGYTFDQVYYLDFHQKSAQKNNDFSFVALAESFKQSQWPDVIATLRQLIRVNREIFREDQYYSKTAETEIPLEYRLEQEAVGKLFDRTKALMAKSTTPVHMIEHELNNLPEKFLQRKPNNREIAIQQYQIIIRDCIRAARIDDYITPTLGFIFNDGSQSQEYMPVLHNAKNFSTKLVRQILIEAKKAISISAGKKLTPEQVKAIQKAIDYFNLYFQKGFRVDGEQLQLFDFGDDGREFMIQVD